MNDLQQFLMMMTKDIGNGISNKIIVEGDEYTSYVSFFQRGMSGPVCECVNKTNQEVTFMFESIDGSFKGVEGAIG
jgi:hypothetical protein